MEFESISFKEVCRLCIVNPKTDVIHSTASSSSFDDITYAELIKMVSSKFVFPEENDFSFSNGICKECSEKLINFYEFKILIETSQIQLEAFLSNKSTNQTLEIFKDEEFLDTSFSDQESVEKLEDQDCGDKMELCINNARARYSTSSKSQKPPKIQAGVRKKYLLNETNILPVEEQEVWQKKLNSWIKKQQELENYNETKIKPYVCHVCGKSYASTFSLRDHSIVHTGELNFQCIECGKRFGLKKNLTAHIKTKHTQCEMFYCEICGFGFNRRSNLKTHRWVHKDLKRYSCDFCGKNFKWRNGLSIHINMHHGGSRKYSCHICGKTYLSSSSRGKHCRIVHGGLGMKPIESTNEI